MSPHHLARAACRVAAAGALTLMAAFALAGPAFAHAEVEADTPQALAENVTLTFTSEAESGTAGFTQVRVVLPDGIAPGDVTLDDAPQGWKLTTTADGYTVGGPVLETGVDAEHAIEVEQLPDAEQVAFKTVETYSDGKVSRWIELSTGSGEPEQSAPVLRLKPAAPGANPIRSGSATTGTPGATPATPAGDTAAGAQRAEETAAARNAASPVSLTIGGTIAGLLVLGGGAWWLTRRRAARDAN